MTLLNDTHKDFIKREEGLRLSIYLDSAGKPTIGYGHLIKPNEDFSNGITLKQANDLFERDLQERIPAISNVLVRELNPNQFGAIVSFVYNIGLPAFKLSHVLQYINSGEFSKVPEWMLKWKWVTTPHGREPQLLPRRKREVSLWMTPYGS